MSLWLAVVVVYGVALFGLSLYSLNHAALALVFFREPGRWRAAAALGFLVAAGLSFVYFLPVLAAGVGVGPAAFTERVWLPSWR